MPLLRLRSRSRLIAAPSFAPTAAEVHHEIPRCVLATWDRGHGPGLEPEDLAAWCHWQEEAHRYGVDPNVSRDELAALIEGSTVETPREEHRDGHAGASLGGAGSEGS